MIADRQSIPSATAPPIDPEKISYKIQLRCDGIKSTRIFLVLSCQLATIANTPPTNAAIPQSDSSVKYVEIPSNKINSHITIGLPIQFVLVLNEKRANRSAATLARAAPVYASIRIKCVIQNTKLKS